MVDCHASDCDMKFPSLNQLRIAIAVQFLLACGTIYFGIGLQQWRKMPPEAFPDSPDAYSHYNFTQKTWLALSGVSIALTIIFALVALRRRQEIDSGTKQVKLHWTLLFVPPVCAMIHSALIWF
jgi:hypothetical protein